MALLFTDIDWMHSWLEDLVQDEQLPIVLHNLSISASLLDS